MVLALMNCNKNIFLHELQIVCKASVRKLLFLHRQRQKFVSMKQGEKNAANSVLSSGFKEGISKHLVATLYL